MAGVGHVVARVVVRGAVQGVGFRWFVREYARSRNVHGWVGNRTDGSVELLARGDENAIQQLLDAVRRGPPGARVDACDVNVVDPAGLAGELLNPFDIRRGLP